VLSALRADADTWIVAQDGSGDFTQLSVAVRAAADGDVLVLLDGTYDGALIRGKGLELVAHTMSDVVTGQIRVEDLAPDQHVALSGFLVRSTQTTHELQGALYVSNCRGSVRCQAMHLGSESYWGDDHLGAGAQIEHSANVSLVNSISRGGGKFLGSSSPQANPGMLLSNSNVSLHGCGVAGAPSLNLGGAAVQASATTLFISGSGLSGGAGQETNEDYCKLAQVGSGGDGLVLQDASLAYLQDSTVAGGVPGHTDFPCWLIGASGTAFVISPGSEVVQLPGDYRDWSISNLGFQNGTLRVNYKGLPGDRVFLTRSPTPDFTLDTSLNGLLLLVPLNGLAFIGPVDPSGDLVVDLALEQVLTSEPARGFFLQLFVVDADNERLIGGPGHVAVANIEDFSDCNATIFVDDDGLPGAAGTHWASAMPDLQVALDLARERYLECGVEAEIWIAEGTYRPSTQATGELPAFFIDVPVHIYGGFVGTELDPSQRDVEAHPSLLTGDWLGNDAPSFYGYWDNAAAVLLIRNQYDLTQDKVVVDGLVFAGARDGAGLWLDANGYGSSVEVRQCIFRDNKAESTAAAGLFGAAFRALLLDCSFERNLCFAGYAAAQLAFPGLGLESEARVLGCEFRDNVALYDGSGGTYIGAGWTSIANSLFIDNRGHDLGLINGADSPTTTLLVTGCTLIGNSVAQGPAGIGTSGYYSFVRRLENSILWGNTSGTEVGEAAQLGGGVNSDFTCWWSLIEGWTGTFAGSGCFDRNPLTDANGRPGPGSPCIDAGNNDLVPADDLDLDQDGDWTEPLETDLAGAPRFADVPSAPDTGQGSPPLVDIGAYEAQGP
jgi:hypothetical protein